MLGDAWRSSSKMLGNWYSNSFDAHSNTKSKQMTMIFPHLWPNCLFSRTKDEQAGNNIRISSSSAWKSESENSHYLDVEDIYQLNDVSFATTEHTLLQKVDEKQQKPNSTKIGLLEKYDISNTYDLDEPSGTEK